MKVQKLKITIKPSSKRWLLRPFVPGNPQQVEHILLRILSTDKKHTYDLCQRVFHRYKNFHKDIQDIFLRHFENIQHKIASDMRLEKETKLIIGAYFSQFYALKSTALFNPSIVPHPDSSGKNKLNIILGLRAVGEGHISSLVFREAEINENFDITVKEPQPFIMEPKKNMDRKYDKFLFGRKLGESGALNDVSKTILDELPENFTFQQLDAILNFQDLNIPDFEPLEMKETMNVIRNLGLSDYDMYFHKEQDISERVIFPMSPSQVNGIEDARFIKFENDDGSFKYYATFTAFDGRNIVPELLETKDFLHFKVSTLHGPFAKNKGMAMFPKKIGGQYKMLGRQDNESIYLMSSGDPLFWHEAIPIAKPTYAWEFIQIGNCSPPIELNEGWLVITHGVGALRRYCLGALLLDKTKPEKIIGRLKKPLLEPVGEENFGYVPNVLYTCGALVHKGKLILPYAVSDYKTMFALIDVQDILNEMV